MATAGTTILQSVTSGKIRLLIRMAKEMGIRSSVLSAAEDEGYSLSLAVEMKHKNFRCGSRIRYNRYETNKTDLKAVPYLPFETCLLNFAIPQ